MFYLKAAGGTNGAELQIYYNVQEYFMGEEQVQMEQSFKYTN